MSASDGENHEESKKRIKKTKKRQKTQKNIKKHKKYQKTPKKHKKTQNKQKHTKKHQKNTKEKKGFQTNCFRADYTKVIQTLQGVRNRAQIYLPFKRKARTNTTSINL